MDVLEGNGLDTMTIIPANRSYDCLICGTQSLSPIQLTIHYIVFHDFQACMECMKLFENHFHLNEHYQSKHFNNSYNCSECSKQYHTEKLLHVHNANDHSRKLCNLCKQCIRIDDVESHSNEIHKINKCNADDGIFIQLNDNEFSCKLCNRSNLKIERFFSHYLFIHKCSLEYVLKCIFEQCENTSEFLKLTKDTAENSNNHETEFCSYCKLNYTLATPKIFHKIYCQNDQYCDYCDELFSNNDLYDTHIEKCSNRTRIKSNICEYCDINEMTISLDQHHQEIHSILSKISSHSKLNLFSKENKCNFCEVDLSHDISNLNKLVHHFQIDHHFNKSAIKKYLRIQKTENDYSFVSIEESKPTSNYVEIRSIEPTVNSFLDFDSRMVNYIYPSESESEDSDPLRECCICINFTTKSKQILLLHMHQKHGFLLREYKSFCKLCNRSFKNRRTLRKHCKNLHGTPADGFKCTFCNFSSEKQHKIR